MKLPRLPSSGSLFRGTLASLAIRMLDMAVAYGLVIVLARYLGVDEFGEYTFILSIVTILAIPARFGLPALLVRETGFALARDEPDRLFDLKAWAYRRAISISLPILLLGIAFAVFFPSLLGGKERITLVIGLALVTLFPISAIRAAILRGLDEIVSSQLTLQVVRPAVQLMLVGGLWAAMFYGVELLPPTSSVAMAANVIGALVSWVCGAILLKRFLPKRPDYQTRHIEIAGWRSSLTALGLANAMYIIDAQVGIVLLGFLAADAEVGLYKIAAQGAMVVAIGYGATNVPITPKIAKSWAKGETDKVKRLVVRGSQISFLFALPVSAAILLLGHFLIVTLLGASFEGAYIPLLILTFGQLINSAFGSASSLLNMTHNEKTNLIAFAVAIAVNIPLGILLIPEYGAMGGALASASSVITRNLLLWIYALRLLGINTAFWARVPKPIQSEGTEK